MRLIFFTHNGINALQYAQHGNHGAWPRLIAQMPADAVLDGAPVVLGLFGGGRRHRWR